jgi:hypothetical protein
MIAGGAGLENRLVFQGPGASRVDLPGLQIREPLGHGLKIFPMVRPEVQSGALPCPAGDCLEEARLQHTVLMVALFGPRIGKQHPDFPKSNLGRQGVEKFQRLGPDKVAVGEVAALGLAEGAGDSFAAQVDPDADLGGEFRGITFEEMAVPATDLPDDGLRRREQRGEFSPQGGTPLGDELDKGRFEIHGPYWREAEAGAIPKLRLLAYGVSAPRW